MDPALSPAANIITPQKDWSAVLMDSNLIERLDRLAKELLNKKEKESIVFYLTGPYGAGKKLTAEAFCYQMNLPLIIVDTNELLTNNFQLEIEEILNRLFRETLLQPAAIYLEHFDRLAAGNSREIHLHTFFWMIFSMNSIRMIRTLEQHSVCSLHLVWCLHASDYSDYRFTQHPKEQRKSESVR